MQAAIDQYYPLLPAFFGRSKSTNNEIYRKWGIKQRTNDEMREDFQERARALVEGLARPAAAIGIGTGGRVGSLDPEL